MTGQPRPWRPEDFDDCCETCGAPPGQLCKPWCDTGYTAEDARREAVRRQETADRTATSLAARNAPDLCPPHRETEAPCPPTRHRS